MPLDAPDIQMRLAAIPETYPRAVAMLERAGADPEDCGDVHRPSVVAAVAVAGLAAVACGAPAYQAAPLPTVSTAVPPWPLVPPAPVATDPAPLETAPVARVASATPAPPATPAPAVAGLLTFRGNATRSYYGEGPVPAAPAVAWRYPQRPMCSSSVERGVPSTWCGTGWTGQPAVVERPDGTWVVFGAYDGAVHFLDAATGRRRLPDFPTGDLVKGSVTIDPDGFPLVYVGSRDGQFRIVAFDGDRPRELWSLPAWAVEPVLWNDDWDGSALVVGGYLFEGGENSQWHVVELNRSYGPDGLVAVDPVLAFHAPGWDDDLLAALGDTQVSIEGSLAMHDGVVYFANSGGLVQGWDVSGLGQGRPPTRVFRYWVGDDVDATVVIDDEGMLYVAAEWERHTARAREVGQVLKLDPGRADPLVWSLPDRGSDVAGVWATPALWQDLVIVATHEGRLLGINRATGRVRWTRQVAGPAWQSPVVVDGVLVQGGCDGILRGYDVADTTLVPPELWAVPVGGCIESTPAVWRGRIFVGTRAGYVVALGEG
jgi:outer membrane protein assembly factor BamB